MSEHEPKPVAWMLKLIRKPGVVRSSLRPMEDMPELDGELWEEIPLYPASVVTALQEENERLGQQCEGMAQAAANNAQDLILKYAALKAAEARANADERKRALEEAASYIEGREGRIPGTNAFASLLSRNNQPCMSGDARDRLHTHDRRNFDDATSELAATIRSLMEKLE